MKELTVGSNDAGQRLDRFLSKAVPLLPESLLQKYIRLKRIKCNGKAVKRDYRLCAGDLLTLYVNDEFFEKLVDKKPGILCHSDGTWDYHTLIANIQAYLAIKGEWRPKEENSFTPALCNRIDRNTGGIVIAAKNAETLRVINQKIKDREIEKFYLCAVIGKPRPESGMLENELFKDAVKNTVYVKNRPEPGSRSAKTEYRVLQSRNNLSLVECRLLTGRTHQIRVQMAYAGWPLLGDGKYGREDINRRYHEHGQALYSWRLVFEFQTPAEHLEYLRGKEFRIDPQKIDFCTEYFDTVL